MEMRIKREETRRIITVLFVTFNKKTHTVSALTVCVFLFNVTSNQCNLDCTVH